MSQLSTVAARFEEDAPNLMPEILLEPLGTRQVEDVEMQLYLMQGAIGFVLLIACANIANLLLVRVTGREREIIVRRALGADSWRIFRLLFAESLILSLSGGVAGLAMAGSLVRGLLAAAPFELPRSHNIELDTSALALTAVATFVCALFCGTFPALRLSRLASSDTLSGHRATAPLRLQSSFAVAQIALATVLLAGAGLLLRSFHELTSVDPGFETTHRLSFRLSLHATEAYADDQARLAFHQRLEERLRQVPGALAVARTSYLPVLDIGSRACFSACRLLIRRPLASSSPSSPWRRSPPATFRHGGRRGSSLGWSCAPNRAALVTRRWPLTFMNAHTWPFP